MNWQNYKICEIGKLVTGKTPKTSVKEFYGGNIPFLTPSDDLDSKYSFKTKKYLTNEGMESVKSTLIPQNSICVSCIGSDLGKVDKERVVYFDAKAKLHIQNYIESRNDNEDALFVSLKAPYKRITIGGIESRLRNFGKKIGINRLHPHKFRRSLATIAIDKGMPIEQLQKILGHKRIDTTLQYAMVKQNNVKLAHQKFIG